MEKVQVTAESWAELKASKALVLVELHKAWTGPCVVLGPTLKAIENALPQPEKQIIFAMANVDTLKDVPEFAERASDKSIVPEFWLMLGGKNVHVVKGANPAALESLVKESVPEIKDENETQY